MDMIFDISCIAMSPERIGRTIFKLLEKGNNVEILDFDRVPWGKSQREQILALTSKEQSTE